VCATYRDGMWWYRDGGHLSVTASKQLGARLAAVIEDGARA
jgi:hypothetical protein